ncbi:MAG: hypothetical protein JOZ16_07320 [Methylobacteriaceae bacterium]|nr:hypothetical protein [Methylobacteriaceae bacterium]
MQPSSDTSSDLWPALPYAELRPTLETLQLFAQVAGKTRLAGTPWLNHSWHVTFTVSGRGLITGLIPHGRFSFDIEFDFVSERVELRTTTGTRAYVALAPKSVASFYAEFGDALASLGIALDIDRMPNELPDPTPFDQDNAMRVYDADAARRFWHALVQAERVMQRFRTRFIGKCSPMHFFWGSFDLAVTRFSGRRAPLHPGGIPHLNDDVTREAYSHEVSSAGFWPGSPGAEAAAFYSYAYPVPAGFGEARVTPAAARFDKGLGEFVLPYDAVRNAADPDAMLLEFLESTYEAAADLAKWDRAELECEEGRVGLPRRVR